MLVDIDVAVPQDTPEGATVYLSGNLAEVGNSKPDGVRLSRLLSGTRAGKYNFRLFLPKGEQFEFKFTLGSWGNVEVDADGREVAPRVMELTRNRIVDVKVEAWAEREAHRPRRTTISGDIRVISDFESKTLGNKRRIWVYLPPGYDGSSERYPVLYLHDGQNCFDDATSNVGEWGADETAERLIRHGEIRPIIMVAADNIGAGRMDEYAPTVDLAAKSGGKGDDYAKFLITELKPHIDRTFRTLSGRENTAVCGASGGGLVSLHIARRYPDDVGMCAALSPPLNWSKFDLHAKLIADPSFVRRCRLWIDAGTLESPPYAFGMVGRFGSDDELTEACRQLAQSFEQAGLQRGRDFVYLEVENGQHNEQAWAARFDQVLLFLFGKP